jgi:hypothetical protein
MQPNPLDERKPAAPPKPTQNYDELTDGQKSSLQHQSIGKSAQSLAVDSTITSQKSELYNIPGQSLTDDAKLAAKNQC